MNQKTDSAWRAAVKRAPLSFLIGTGFGVGLMPFAPGTWGSLAGVALYRGIWKVYGAWLKSAASSGAEVLPTPEMFSFLLQCYMAPVLLALGVWVSGRVAGYSGIEDPQFVVVDEISGQQLALLLGTRWGTVLNWKYLLAGFILFRVFDIWKPFPIRKAEQLPGGWGIMADDWIAGIYAALVLWVARAMGL